MPVRRDYWWLHFRVVEEVGDTLPIMLQPDSIRQSLLVCIAQPARPQPIGQVPFDLFGSVGLAGNRAGPLLPPQLIGVLE